MATMFPVSGSLAHYPTRFVDPALGFAGARQTNPTSRFFFLLSIGFGFKNLNTLQDIQKLKSCLSPIKKWDGIIGSYDS